LPTAAPKTTLKFNNTLIGTGCHGLTCEVLRARQPNVQHGLGRTQAMLTDKSPNLYYRLRVFVHHKEASQIRKAVWAVGVGDLMAQGLKTVEISEQFGETITETLTMDNAAMTGPVVAEYREGENGRLIRGMMFEFVSASKPVQTAP
jgi:hypothetical protein